MDRLLCPWNSPSKNTGVGNHSVLQGTFPTKGSNPSLPHCRQILHHLSHQGKHVPSAMKLNMSTQTWCKVGAHYMFFGFELRTTIHRSSEKSWRIWPPASHLPKFWISCCRGLPHLWHQGPVSWKTIFPWLGVWFGDDSSALHLLYIFLLLLLH